MRYPVLQYLFAVELAAPAYSKPYAKKAYGFSFVKWNELAGASYSRGAVLAAAGLGLPEEVCDVTAKLKLSVMAVI